MIVLMILYTILQIFGLFLILTILSIIFLPGRLRVEIDRDSGSVTWLVNIELMGRIPFVVIRNNGAAQPLSIHVLGIAFTYRGNPGKKSGKKARHHKKDSQVPKNRDDISTLTRKINIIRTELPRVRRMFRVEYFRLKARIGLSDPYSTGILYGIGAALVKWFDLESALDIVPDFTAQSSILSGKLETRFSPTHVIFTAIRVGIRWVSLSHK